MRITLFLFLFVASLFAQKFDNVDTFESDFIQTVKNQSGKEIEYRGKVFVKKPNKIKWQYKEPIEKNVFINGDFAIIDEPELEQAIYTSLEKEINLIKLIENSRQVSGDRYKTVLYENDYFLIFEGDVLTKITFTDELENDIEIAFGENALNKELPDHLFSFRVPSHYDIIRK